MWRRAPAPAVKTLQGSMLSDPGLKRALNEDRAAYILPKDKNDAAVGNDFLAIVADGMGGHAAGEVASAMAIDIVYRTYVTGKGPPDKILKAGLRAANAAIYQHAQSSPECRGMGTTCTAVAVREGRAFLAHVGDSRCYLLRADRLHQLSEDHSLVSDLVRAGVIREEEGRTRPDRNIILRAIGTKPTVEVAAWGSGLALKPGDVLLLCSDGLTDGVPDEAIRDILKQGAPPMDTCRLLIGAALSAGGEDNITVGVFLAHGGQPMAASPPDASLRATRVTRIEARSE
jgi:serine/threonine protein phosphatase PrpC